MQDYLFQLAVTDFPGARNNVWTELINDGADWLNADDLEAASSF